VPIFAARAWLIHLDLASPLTGAAAWGLAATGSLFTWLITFGFLGLALGTFDRPRPAIRYLADSSYWIYLCHLPIVGLVQVDLFSVPIPAVFKFLAVVIVSMGLGLASYQAIVRHTLIGVWLHGRRERRRDEVFRKGAQVMRSSTYQDSRARNGARGIRIVALLAALGAALPSGCSSPAQTGEARALANIQKKGGTFERDPRLEGEPVVKVDLAAKAVGDADLEALKPLAQLNSLILRGTKITDLGLAILKTTGKLRNLDLDRSAVTDQGLEHVAAMSSLRALHLAGTMVTDAGLAHLSGLSKLLVLSLKDTQVSDAGLVHLAKLSKLQVLNLENTKVTGAAAAKLRKDLPRARILVGAASQTNRRTL
jgi:hypothetical protein